MEGVIVMSKKELKRLRYLHMVQDKSVQTSIIYCTCPLNYFLSI